ncbi:hypothetical protein L1D50_16495 [Pseudoalteromonas sp. Isolate6]|uniref:hypothetical protein n=1 Tax=Pseudoalteromonas sp. Isolate6 TaxID=2908527 RepID=UPI001EFD6376|nr:hypothetical protein [Pseudoalteromonas sp. Isolate6]MCG9760703.1 hypothetical protein [Pseudoalteromonas sp. Isolate6]
MSEKDITPTVEKALVDGKDLLASKQGVLMKLGNLQAFTHIKNYATVAEVILFKNIRESKEYKGLTYHAEDGSLRTVATIDEFCPVFLGRSYRTLKEAEDHLNAFGEEFYESSKQIGIGNRELRALRQLPEDEQALVIESEAVETGDKEAVKELIDELKAKHAKEKEKITQELDATERMLKVSRDSSSKKEEEIIKLKTDLESKKFSAERWKGEAKSFFEALAKTQNQVREGFNQMLVLSEQLETVKIDDKTYDAAKSAFYADSKILLTQLAHVWNEIHRTYGDLDDARPSGEWLAEMGFEGTEVME